MITNRSTLDQTWVDLNSPTKEEVDSVVLTQNISPLIAKDLLTPTPFQHAENEGGILYAVLHIPTFRHNNFTCESQEIDFIILKNSLITARYDSIDALHYFGKQIEVNEILNRGSKAHLFFGMISEVYKSLSDELSYMDDWIKRIEKNIFEGQEKSMVLAISSVSRNLLNFKKMIEPHGSIFETIKEIEAGFGKEFEKENRILIEEWRRTMKRVNGQLEMINELRETNNSMLSTKQNEVMKTFTILAFTTLPLSLLAAIFGMNTSFIPIVGHEYDFWIVIGIMFVISLAMFSYFKYKKWV